MRRIPSTPAALFAAAAFTTASPALASGPASWHLDRIEHGENPNMRNHPAVRVDSVDVSGGSLQVTICCSLDPLASCETQQTYRLGWRFAADPTIIHRGQDIVYSLSAERVGGGECPSGSPAPYVVPGGTQNLVTLPPNGGDIFEGVGTGPFEPAPVGPFHVPNPRKIHVRDVDDMSQQGLFNFNFDQKWGLSYEVVFVYGAVALPPPGSPDAGSGAIAGGDGGAAPGFDPPPGPGGGSAGGTSGGGAGTGATGGTPVVVKCSSSAGAGAPAAGGIGAVVAVLLAAARRRPARRR